jgi:hypothetical protein
MEVHKGVVTLEDGRKFYGVLTFGPWTKENGHIAGMDVYHVDENDQPTVKVSGEIYNQRIGNDPLWYQIFDCLSETPPTFEE